MDSITIYEHYYWLQCTKIYINLCIYCLISSRKKWEMQIEGLAKAEVKLDKGNGNWKLQT